MDIPFEERSYSYIAARIPRLKKQAFRVTCAALMGWFFCVGIVLVDNDKFFAGLLAAILIYFGLVATKASLNLHIDMLTAFKHDLDRDQAENLVGFHTPD